MLKYLFTMLILLIFVYKYNSMKSFLTRHKFKVWLTALTPLAMFISGPLGLLFLIIQLLAFVAMFWIGWNNIFDNL